MHYRELHAFTRRSLKGHFPAAMGASLLLPAAELVSRALPAMLAAVLLINGTMTAQSLFLGRDARWVLVTALWSGVSACILLPVRLGTGGWFSGLVGLEETRRQCFPTVCAYLRALYFFGITALLRFLAAAPMAAAGALAVFALRQSAEAPEAGLWLFLAVQGMAGMFWAGLYYLRFCIGMAAVPFLFLEEPARPVLAAVRDSQRMLAGHRMQLAGVILRRLPAALPAVTLPFVLPYLFADVTLFLQIRMREYARDKEVPDA